MPFFRRTTADREGNLGTLYSLLASADESYNMMPPGVRLEIEKISQGLTEFGPRKLQRSGMGTELFEARPYRDGVDVKQPNAKLSARAGKRIVVETEAEIRQHFYLWRDSSDSTKYSSDDKLFTVKEAEEVMLLAFAKHLARNEEMIGILDRQGQYRGGKAPEWIGQQLAEVTIVTGGMPAVARPLPRNSTVVLFSDFLMDADELVKGLDHISGVGLKGFLVMVLDPEEIEFKRFKGHTEFQGMEGEGRIAFKKAESLQEAYKKTMQERIEWIKRLCAAKGFEFILQRTDKPLHEGLLSIYGLSPRAEGAQPAPGL
jgi:uncharacterized protein (DUF58 family)